MISGHFRDLHVALSFLQLLYIQFPPLLARRRSFETRFALSEKSCSIEVQRKIARNMKILVERIEERVNGVLIDVAERCVRVRTVQTRKHSFSGLIRYSTALHLSLHIQSTEII